MNLAERALSSLVPKSFQDFLGYVSPGALGVVHKERVLKMAVSIAQHSVGSEHYQKAYLQMEQVLSEQSLPISMTDQALARQLGQQDLAEATRKRVGELVLSLYFVMIESEVPLFLDLRPAQFYWDESQQILQWHPSKLFHVPGHDFHYRIQKLYEGFFENNPIATEVGIELYRWESKPKAGFDERMQSLLMKHFGSAQTEDVHFSMKHFKETFGLIFQEAIASKSKFHPELSFLGATLATLYVTLELLDQELPVREIYQNQHGQILKPKKDSTKTPRSSLVN